MKDLTSLPAVSPSLKILFGLCLDDFHVFPKMSNVESSLQHLLLFQKDLQHIKEDTVIAGFIQLQHAVIPFSSNVALWICLKLDFLRWTHSVGDIVGYSFAKHRSGQSGVDILCIQVVVLAVEHQRGCFAAEQVGERAPHHGETEHRAVLWAGSRQAGINQCLVVRME